MPGEGKKRVTVFVNGRRVNGKAIYVPKKWNEFVKSAGRKLGINATRIFNEEGGEMDELELIGNKDVLFISSGDNFIPPTTVDNSGMFILSSFALFLLIGGYVVRNSGGDDATSDN